MKARIRGMARFDKDTQAAIINVAHEQFEDQEDKYIQSAFELILWSLHKEFGFGPSHLKRAYRRMYKDFDENCARYGLNQDTSKWSRKRRAKELTYTYAQWVHDRLLSYGVDVAAWQNEQDAPTVEVEIR